MSSYIGNFNPQMVFPENTRDDIVPAPPQATFLLSQEVPGGYESNVLVYRKQFKQEVIITNTDALEFVTGLNEIRVIGDSLVSSLLSRIQVGDTISISGAVETENNGNHLVISVSYVAPDDITFVVASPLENEDSNPVDVSRGFDGPWETLQPETDYTIGGVFPNKDREITFSQAPEEEDEIYVIHRGAATYNLVPTNNSVGPDQLSQNLRNFVIDRFDGDGVEDTFTLSQEVINSKTILVTVDGDVLDGDDPLVAFDGDWELTGPTEITFDSPPANLSKIRVLHLGFSTVSRRASLSAGQVGAVAPNSITQLELSNGAVTTPKILDGAVTTSKIAADSVTGTRILLANNESLRARKASTAPTGILKVDPSDRTVILSDTVIRAEVNGTAVLDIDEDKAEPVTDNTFDLGSPSNKFKEIHAHLVNGIDLTTVGGLPAGTIVMTAAASAESGWLLCRGQAVSRVTFANLFTKIGTVWGVGDGITTFNLPDLRQRIPIGQTDVAAQPATNLATQFGSINHTHDFTHTHNVDVTGTLPNHTHSVGTLVGDHPHTHRMLPHGHYHSLTAASAGAHTHSLSGTTGNAGGHTHTITARTSGVTDSANIVSRAVSANIATQINSNAINPVGDHAHSISGTALSNGSHSHAVGGSVGSGTPLNIVDDPTNNLPTGPASNPAVTISGVTGDPSSSPSIASSGSSVDQSTNTTGTANPPCLVLNFMIKT